MELRVIRFAAKGNNFSYSRSFLFSMNSYGVVRVIFAGASLKLCDKSSWRVMNLFRICQTVVIQDYETA